MGGAGVSIWWFRGEVLTWGMQLRKVESLVHLQDFFGFRILRVKDVEWKVWDWEFMVSISVPGP